MGSLEGRPAIAAGGTNVAGAATAAAAPSPTAQWARGSAETQPRRTFMTIHCIARPQPEYRMVVCLPGVMRHAHRRDGEKRGGRPPWTIYEMRDP